MTKREKDLVYHAALLATLHKATHPEKRNTEVIDTVVAYVIEQDKKENQRSKKNGRCKSIYERN